MPDPDPRQVARFIDRARRLAAPHRPGAVVRPLAHGWITAQPGKAPGETPSSSTHRICWLDPPAPLSASDLNAAVGELRALNCAAAYAWIAPWAVAPAFEEALAAAGAARWPRVEYVALVRDATPLDTGRRAPFPVRRVQPHEFPEALAAVEPWYFPGGLPALAAQARTAVGEVFMAFDGAVPVGVAFVQVLDAWAYLGAAATHPAFQSRGIQTSLIAARLARAADLGAHRCAAETNTVGVTSLRNLLRCGFVPAVTWRVYHLPLG